MDNNYLEIWQGLTEDEKLLLVKATEARIMPTPMEILIASVLHDKGLFAAGKATKLGRQVVEFLYGGKIWFTEENTENVKTSTPTPKTPQIGTGVSNNAYSEKSEGRQIVAVATAYAYALWTTGDLTTEDGLKVFCIHEDHTRDEIYIAHFDGMMRDYFDFDTLAYTPRADVSAAEAEVERLRAALRNILATQRYGTISAPTDEVIALLQDQVRDMWEIAREALKGEGDDGQHE